MGGTRRCDERQRLDNDVKGFRLIQPCFFVGCQDCAERVRRNAVLRAGEVLAGTLGSTNVARIILWLPAKHGHAVTLFDIVAAFFHGHMD